jgi:RNA polymerase sigma factor (sigma-70 family)
MLSGGSVTQWIGQLKAGEGQALEKLRQRYWPYLVGLAHKKLGGTRRAELEDEDVAQEAFVGFYRQFQAGQLPCFENRQHLFALLTIITARKAATHLEREGRLKRGAGQVQGESALEYLAHSSTAARGLDQVADSANSPAEQALLNDQYSHFVNALPEALRDIAEQFLAGRSNHEIAESRGCAVRTVERKLKDFILPHWQRLAADSVNVCEELSDV